ncbi:MAG: LamG-like jellyroll fold domain-containing protein [Planctomycetota bacterium]|nr:LamG-like jellyroll fold domain-containing protein [Planctomycetota bacterium]
MRDIRVALVLMASVVATGMVIAADPPTADLRWDFREGFVGSSGAVKATAGGLDGQISGDLVLADGGTGPMLLGGGANGMLLVAENHKSVARHLPTQNFSISCWVVLEEVMEWGSVFCSLQDNGDFEKGWLLGTRRGAPCLALSSKGADDGNGLMTYLEGTQQMTLGKWHHIAGSYDGKTMKVFLDGEMVGESGAQSGPILYPAKAPLVIGSYVDDNENHPHIGAIQDLRLWRTDLSAVEMSAVSRQRPGCTESLPPRPPLAMVVAPYLQWGTTDGITVCFETNRPTVGVVEYGATANLGNSALSDEPTKLHHVRIEGLETGTPYFYRVRVHHDGNPEDGVDGMETGILTFQTAADTDTAFGFLVVGDTQNNPKVTKSVSDLAWGHRPNFIVHCGDLVGTGSNKREWVHQFFAGAADILCRYSMFPTLGNHEQNAALYYQYFTMPDPEYYYQYSWGNTDFFVVDTNKRIASDTDQVKWLENALAASESTWKVVYHHHPAWTSDENDYGNTWKGGSDQGYPPVQKTLTPLYEKYGVDVVFNGHIHVYERTWPIKNGKTVPAGEGVVYITTGGGGGSLENFAPNRTWFSSNKRIGHHFMMVNVNGPEMEISAFDIEGRLFDRTVLLKENSDR